ncbi:hypothetical protein GF354_01290 [Candidatus Peregrinibacteria bacterium]|nr:hypothetical protein [Candidatus Peregrinibacteria bacterium]
MKHKIYILLIIFVMLLSSSFAAFAQEEEDEAVSPYDVDAYIGGAVSPYKCIVKGNLDFILFLETLIWSDGFYEGVIEPFVDVINRNQCHALDVLNLIKQRDKIRSYIRKAFLTCKNENIPNLKRGYNELNAEIYYVRHVVDGAVIGGLPFTSLSIYNSAHFYPTEKLYSEMYERFVTDSNEFSEQDFNVLFNKLEAKYSDRKNSYILCEKATWEEVSEKWDEFIETAGGITPAWENLENGVAGRAEKLWEAATDFTYVDYLSAIVQVNLNGQPFLTEFSDILDNLEQSTELSGESYESSETYITATHEQVVSVLEEDSYEYRLNNLEREMSARFEVQYKNTSDSAISTFLEELDTLNTIIIGTFTPMDTVFNCVSFMNDKQCPGQ